MNYEGSLQAKAECQELFWNRSQLFHKRVCTWLDMPSHPPAKSVSSRASQGRNAIRGLRKGKGVVCPTPHGYRQHHRMLASNHTHGASKAQRGRPDSSTHSKLTVELRTCVWPPATDATWGSNRGKRFPTGKPHSDKELKEEKSEFAKQ